MLENVMAFLKTCILNFKSATPILLKYATTVYNVTAE